MIPENAKHPGEFLKFYIQDLELSQAELARKVGTDLGTINAICDCRAGITVELAAAIAEALGTTQELWLNAQNNFELSKSKA